MAPRARPNSRWVCGYQDSGSACQEGPTEKGVCCQKSRATTVDSSDCQANCACGETCELAKLRNEAELPSHEQLGPCVPRKSDSFARQSIALNFAILTGGILLLCMALPIREQVFVPGSLSSKHSQILGNRLVSDRCSLCHSPVHGTLIESLTGPGVGEIQDDLCMKCHQAHMPDASLRSPHDLNTEQLKLISFNAVGESSARTILGSQNGVAELQLTRCASCHVEHHGSEHKLAAITDARCQACHQKQFASLASGHPEFDGFPYKSQRSIKFDHVSHSGKHFSTKSQEFDCRGCHLQSSGGSGAVLRTLGFEQACAACHSEPITAAAVSGWAVLQLPSIESEQLAELPSWPVGAQYGADGQISKMMQALLLVDPAVAPVLSRLPDHGQLAEIEDKTLQSELAIMTARSVRNLIVEVANGGHDAWRNRLIGAAKQRLGRELTAAENSLVDEMTAGLPPDLFQHMARNWLQPPNELASGHSLTGKLVSGPQEDDSLLDSNEVEELLEADSDAAARLETSGDTEAKRDIELTRLTGAKHVTTGGWYLDEQLYALRYMPRGHGDRTLAAWAQYLTLLQPPSKQAGAVNDKLLDNCLECHAVGGGSMQNWADWKVRARPTTARPFTKFDHSPHLTLPAVNDCTFCHRMSRKEVGDDIRPVGHTVNLPGAQDFVPMQLEQCAACHQKGGAKDGCTTCHNYHVGTSGFDWSH